MAGRRLKVVLAANTDWYLYNFRLPLARRLRSRGDEVVLVSPPGEYARRMEAEGFAWRGLKVARASINPLGELSTMASFHDTYREVRPDLVHHFTPKCTLYGSLAARVAGVPAVVNAVTGMGTAFTSQAMALRLARPLLRRMYRSAFSRGEVIFQNPEDQEDLVQGGLVPAARAHLIAGSGVDTERFRPADPAREGGPLHVLLVARLLREKGIETLVEAARRVHAAGVAARFTVVGEPDPGNPQSIPAAQLAQWRAEGAVEFPGHREDVDALLRGADLFVLPTYYREGVPRSLIEAAASGLPLIASDQRGCNLVVEDGVNGRLVPSRDPAALASAIVQLAGDPGLRRRMGTASRRIACERFSEPRVLDRTLEVYAQALAQAR